MPPRHYTDRSLYRRLLDQARPYWPHIVLVFLLNLLSTPLALLSPLPVKIVVDSVLDSHPLPGILDAVFSMRERNSALVLALAAGMVILLALLTHLQSLGIWLVQTYTGERLVLDFRARVLRHLQRLSLAYHDTQGTADSTYRIQYDATAIQSVAIGGVMPFVTAAFTVTGMVYVTSRIDWQLALVAVLVAPILLVLSQASRHRLRRQWYEVKDLQSSALSVVQEVLSAIRVVKAFGQEEREEKRFVERSAEGVRGQIRLALTQGGFDLLIGTTIGLGMAATLFLGVLHVQSGALTLGELLVVTAYLTQLYGPLETISRRVAALQGALASAERAFAILDEPPDVQERPGARRYARASGKVTFRNVSFSYGPDRPILEQISFDIPPGSRVGIAGTTGAGKSTLVSLLTRFYDPTDGEILVDGIDLRDYRLADLRDQFALVLQEPLLFSTTIRENIGYARPGAKNEEIEAAARAANIHEFIASLPDGYEAQVGERGMRLSGGERQRIALARAFLKDAPILILDEPTSSVDVRTEATIVEAMRHLMRGRTTFLIAHRLSTLEDCDRLLVIEGGRLAVDATDVLAVLREELAAPATNGREGSGVLV